jgi:hypothetical protein
LLLRKKKYKKKKGMPIEIKELHIKAVVAAKQKEESAGVLKAEDINKLKKELTKEVTDKVLRILRQKNER